MRKIFYFTLFTAVLLLAAGQNVTAQRATDAPKPINLFEKKNFEEFDFHFAEPDTKGADVFSFNDDGVLECKGEPFGYVATKKEYKNFKLSLEYCWPEGTKPTNSGVFLRINDQPKENFLPRGFEVQLQNGNAGDLWGFHGMRIEGPKNRHLDRPDGGVTGPMSGVPKIEKAENAPGEWNKVEILASEATVIIVINGKIVNWTNEAEIKAGKIGLQSEGGPINFRNCILTPMP